MTGRAVSGKPAATIGLCCDVLANVMGIADNCGKFGDFCGNGIADVVLTLL